MPLRSRGRTRVIGSDRFDRPSGLLAEDPYRERVLGLGSRDVFADRWRNRPWLAEVRWASLRPGLDRGSLFFGVCVPCHTWVMSGVGHPFAGAGGGSLFEYKVATLLVADLILSRHTEHGGVVAAIEMQIGLAGFDDLRVSVELLGGGYRTVHVQCRYRQRFTTSDVKFGKLVAQAEEAVCGDDSFATGEKRLAVIVDSGSPGHASMTRLCELARDSGDFDRFISVVEAHGGTIKGRWEHCLGASGGLEPELVHRVLAALEVRSSELSTEKSRDSIDLVNRLADVWVPRDLERAMSLGNALFTLLADMGPTAGMIDLSYLQSRLGAFLPGTLGAVTRRARLGRRRDGGHRRIALSMRAVGLDDEEADMLATRALATPPTIAVSKALTVVIGAMGVGKTTELERMHRVAIDRALEDPNAPIPVFLRAGEMAHSSLLTAVSGQAEGLGDPSAVGVHLVIDGLDEAGVQIVDLIARIATLQAEWPNSTVIVGTRPQSTPPGLATVEVKALTPESAESLMAVIHPGVAIARWLREELTEVLFRPLFAIRFALDHRQGNLAGISEGQLIGSVGQQALDDLGRVHLSYTDVILLSYGNNTRTIPTHSRRVPETPRYRQSIQPPSPQRHPVHTRTRLQMAGASRAVRELAHHLHADEPLGGQRRLGPGVPTSTTRTTHRPRSPRPRQHVGQGPSRRHRRPQEAGPPGHRTLPGRDEHQDPHGRRQRPQRRHIRSFPRSRP